MDQVTWISVKGTLWERMHEQSVLRRTAEEPSRKNKKNIMRARMRVHATEFKCAIAKVVASSMHLASRL